MAIQELTEAYNKAKADPIAAYAIFEDGREVRLGFWEEAYTSACEALAAELLNEAHWQSESEFRPARHGAQNEANRLQAARQDVCIVKSGLNIKTCSRGFNV
jgi:hypothetical protein